MGQRGQSQPDGHDVLRCAAIVHRVVQDRSQASDGIRTSLRGKHCLTFNVEAEDATFRTPATLRASALEGNSGNVGKHWPVSNVMCLLPHLGSSSSCADRR